MIPGEVWLADLGIAAKTRPVVVISRRDEDPPRQLVTVVSLTTQNRGSRYEIDLGRPAFLQAESFANTQAIQSIPKTRLIRKLGRLDEKQMNDLKNSLRFALGL